MLCNTTCTVSPLFMAHFSTIHAELYTCNEAHSNLAGFFIYMYQIVHEIRFSNLAGFFIYMYQIIHEIRFSNLAGFFIYMCIIHEIRFSNLAGFLIYMWIIHEWVYMITGTRGGMEVYSIPPYLLWCL